jgi:hypothetical protein
MTEPYFSVLKKPAKHYLLQSDVQRQMYQHYSIVNSEKKNYFSQSAIDNTAL